MMRIDRSFSEAVERAVHAAESGTAAELIVVVAARSGSYLDIAGAAGAAVAMVVLLVALFAPQEFHPVTVAIETPVAFVLAAWVAHRSPGFLGAIAPGARSRKQVERAATEHFVAEAVHGTRGRTGLLVYLSLLEKRVTLLPDFGVEGCVPAAAWAEVRWSATGDPSRPRNRDDVVRGIEQIGAILRAHMPCQGTDLNELSDAPRIVR